MADEPDNLVLQMLRRMDTKLDRVIDDLGDLKVRMTHVEEGLAGVNRRLDRLETRVDRIEKRLDLVDHPYGGVRE
jgi:archaellum component FlaC